MIQQRLPIVAIVVSVALMTAIAIIDVVTSISFLGAMAIGPFVAALAARPKHVATVGAYGIAWVLVLGYDHAHWTSGHWVRIAANLVGVAAAVAAALIRENYVAALLKTTNLADVVQKALLRPLDQRYEDMELQVRYLSSVDGALVGGDVYDAELTQWGLRVLVADVCGHGLEAIDRASTVAFCFREAAHRLPTLAEIADEMNRSLCRRGGADAVDFATALLIEIKDGNVTIANCGHPDPLIVDSRAARLLSPPRRSRPIGLDPAPILVHHTLQASEVLLAYTDGVTEARDAGGVYFDLERHAVRAFGNADLGHALDQLIAAVRRHAANRLRDDIVLLTVRRQQA